MSSPTNRPASDPRSFGPFTVLSKLGEGGMGAVYLAEDPKLKRRVAIKTMQPDLAKEKANRDRFEREARAAAAVEHESIVPILQVGEAADGTPFIVMPFLKGEPLDARLKREPVSPLWLLLKVAREVAEGLAAAHAAGLIHRDIKPANIWLEGDPSSPSPTLQVKRCKILDFGLARSTSEDDIQLTRTGAVLGTPAYMAPEQARGAKVDHRTDLYSLGATLYRMAAGKLPFTAPSTMALLYALANETPQPLRELSPQVPAGVVGMIERLMQKASDNRPRSAGDVVVAFRRFDEREQGQAQPLIPAVVVETLPPPKRLAAEPPANTAPVSRAPTLRPPNKPAQKPRSPMQSKPSDKTEGDAELKSRGTGALIFVGTILVVAAGIIAGIYVVASKKVETPGGEKKNESPKAETSKIDPSPGKVEAEPKSLVTTDSDRKAAEYVLSLGGDVRVNTKDSNINSIADLPDSPFLLTYVNLYNSEKVRDADLIRFRSCQGLVSIDFRKTQVSDTGLRNLQDCVNLEALWLSDTLVGSAGLANFEKCTRLKVVALVRTRVDSDGINHLKECKAIKNLDLAYTKVNDDCLGLIKTLSNLELLDIDGTDITAAGQSELVKALPRCTIFYSARK
jgi:serine/threonine protein kinase